MVSSCACGGSCATRAVVFTARSTRPPHSSLASSTRTSFAFCSRTCAFWLILLTADIGDRFACPLAPDVGDAICRMNGDGDAWGSWYSRICVSGTGVSPGGRRARYRNIARGRYRNIDKNVSGQWHLEIVLRRWYCTAWHVFVLDAAVLGP
eukprot:1530035-Rhodomonas_salina.2